MCAGPRPPSPLCCARTMYTAPKLKRYGRPLTHEEKKIMKKMKHHLAFHAEGKSCVTMPGVVEVEGFVAVAGGAVSEENVPGHPHPHFQPPAVAELPVIRKIISG